MQAPALGDGLAVWLIALAQTLGYACLFYSFAALLPALEAGTGWSRAALALGPTLGLVVAAVAAPQAGRMVDRGLGGEMLWAGPLVGAGALVILSQVDTVFGWYLGWIIAGMGQAVSQYETCFPFLARRLGPGARQAIIRVTLLAGFASTIAFPVGTALSAAFGWRGALLVAAGVMALVTAPCAYVGVARLRARARAAGQAPDRGDAPVPPGHLRAVLRRPEFWLLALIYALISLDHGVLMTYALPLFADLGAGHGLAVLTAATVGPAQVAGRLFLMVNEARLGTWGATRIVIWGLVLAAALLVAARLAPGLLLAYAVAQGAAIGVTSILKPVLSAEVLGRAGFGAIYGMLAVAPLAAVAGAPYVGALLLDAGGTAALLAAAVLMALATLATTALLAARRRREAVG